tara:strand:- start:366 stop:707 length:342 start_codon:yes stop_codon:yes gene_type:complete
MKKCKECDLEMADIANFEVCYNCRHDSGTKKSNDVKSGSDKNNEDTPVQKTENNHQSKNQSFDEQMLFHNNKQTKILIEQHKLQKRISNNVLFFFWISIITFVLSIFSIILSF